MGSSVGYSQLITKISALYISFLVREQE